MAAITTQEELARDATGAGARMTKAVLKQCAVDNEGYESPELNDNLYLHFKGFRKIENLEEYTELKGLWLEANGLRTIENINHLSKLRCIFLSRNLIETIPPTAFRGVSSLVMLDLSENRLTKLEHLADSCPNLETLNVNKNALPDAESIKELAVAKLEKFTNRTQRAQGRTSSKRWRRRRSSAASMRRATRACARFRSGARSACA